ncbi:hypothetical protein BGW39_004856, partial [Mortierella sp. 14UC]
LEDDDDFADVQVFSRSQAPLDFVDVIEPGANAADVDVDVEDDHAIENNDAVDDLLTEHDERDPPFQFIDHQKHDAFMCRRPEILNIDDSELAFFSLFFTDKLVGDMVEYTNKYADTQITSNKMRNPSKDGRG